MSPFHFCLSAAKNLSSFQLLPASLITDLIQLFLGFPLFLFPWGFQNRAAFDISPSSFLNVWPIHLNFLFLISKFISSCPVALLLLYSLEIGLTVVYIWWLSDIKCVDISHFVLLPYTPRMWSPLIWLSWQYSVKSTNYEVGLAQLSVAACYFLSSIYRCLK